MVIDLKSFYVYLMRNIRKHSKNFGLLDALERRVDNQYLLWLRSLLSIYDVEDLIKLGLPWWTFESIQRVERFLALYPEAKVFEYGAGASTLWLAKRASQVHFVEHDPDWMEVLKQYLAPVSRIDGQLVIPKPSTAPQCPSGRKGYAYLDFQEYVAAITTTSTRYDLIVIDGRARIDCLHQALLKINTPGLIIFDNSGRKRYRSYLKNISLPSLKTWGLTPSLPYPESTLLLFSDDNTLKQVVGDT